MANAAQVMLQLVDMTGEGCSAAMERGVQCRDGRTLVSSVLLVNACGCVGGKVPSIVDAILCALVLHGKVELILVPVLGFPLQGLPHTT